MYEIKKARKIKIGQLFKFSMFRWETATKWGFPHRLLSRAWKMTSWSLFIVVRDSRVYQLVHWVVNSPIGTGLWSIGWAENQKVYPIDLGILWDCLHIYGRLWTKKYPGGYNIKFLAQGLDISLYCSYYNGKIELIFWLSFWHFHIITY